MRLLRVAALAAMVVLLAAPVCWGDDCDDLKDPKFADQRIEACTRAINSGKWSGKNQGINYGNRGIAWRVKGQYDKAIADYSQALDYNPRDFNSCYNRGIAWHYKRQYNNAIADYTRAIQLNPTYTSAYYNRAIAYGRKGQYGKAVADYDKTIELTPSHAKAYGNRAYALYKLGRLQEALASAQEGVALDPQNKTKNRKILAFIKKKMAGK